MRIMPISCFRLERRKLKEIPTFDQSFDVLVCAGDLWEGQPEKAVQSVVALARGKPSIIVPGNHDLYTHGPDDLRTISEFIRLLRNEAERQNALAHRDIVTVLSADDPVCELEHVRFIGLTLWTDWAQSSRWPLKELPHSDETFAALARRVAGRSRVREYQAIRTERGPWTPYDALAEHARERAILLDKLAFFHDGPTVVITHHAPLAHCVDVYRGRGMPWWAPAFYGSELLPVLPETMRPDLWVFGHVHAAFDVPCGRTRAIANPVEGGQFNPRFVVELEFANPTSIKTETTSDFREVGVMTHTVKDRRDDLIEAHLRLFHPPAGAPEAAEGYPNCEEGWRDLLERACDRIEVALGRGVFKVLQIKEKFGTLRFYWSGDLSLEAEAKVEEAIALAQARSACTCEICGAEGRLYSRGGWRATACAKHAKGEAVPIKSGFENLRFVRGMVEGRIRIILCRRYDRAADTFVDMDPKSLGIEE
jgi:Calcineurin-like phosphoesterase